MDIARLQDLMSAASVVASVLAIVSIMLVLARGRRDIVGPAAGWLLVVFALGLLAARVLGHFFENDTFQLFRRIAGIVAAVLLPIGLYLALRTHDREETPRVAR
ncbi:MAG: hypothetical protein ACYDCK_11705 [Thermoplasmatota archaeon]